RPEPGGADHAHGVRAQDRCGPGRATREYRDGARCARRALGRVRPEAARVQEVEGDRRGARAAARRVPARLEDPLVAAAEGALAAIAFRLYRGCALRFLL